MFESGFRSFVYIFVNLYFSNFVLKLWPNFYDAWSNLASAYMWKGRLSEAAECFRQALHLNPHLVSLSLIEIIDFVCTSRLAWILWLWFFWYTIQVDAHNNLGNLLKAQGLTNRFSIPFIMLLLVTLVGLYCDYVLYAIYLLIGGVSNDFDPGSTS